MSIDKILPAIFANLSETNKSTVKFFTELYAVLFSLRGRANFENMGRYSSYNESTLRRHFASFFDWLGFNNEIIKELNPENRDIMIAAVDVVLYRKVENRPLD